MAPPNKLENQPRLRLAVLLLLAVGLLLTAASAGVGRVAAAAAAAAPAAGSEGNGAGGDTASAAAMAAGTVGVLAWVSCLAMSATTQPRHRPSLSVNNKQNVQLNLLFVYLRGAACVWRRGPVAGPCWTGWACSNVLQSRNTEAAS